MIQGKTESGFEFEITEEALDDYELLEALHKADKGDTGYLTEAVNLLLRDQVTELKEHVKEIHGRVSMKAMFDEVTQIFGANKEIKN